MKIKKILISQPEPLNGNSPYSEILSKYNLAIDFFPFFRIEPLTAKEFRSQKINLTDFTAVVFTAKSQIDAYFKIAEELRVTIPDTMKYFCLSEAVANYIQKYIVYRKRKIFVGRGTLESVLELVGTKHKEENFLIPTTDDLKTDIHKHFLKAKLQHSIAVLNKTIFNDLTVLDVFKYDLLIFYSPSDLKSLQENYPSSDFSKVLFASFGQSATKALMNAKINPLFTAPTPEAPSISKALSIYMENNKL